MRSMIFDKPSFVYLIGDNLDHAKRVLAATKKNPFLPGSDDESEVGGSRRKRTAAIVDFPNAKEKEPPAKKLAGKRGAPVPPMRGLLSQTTKTHPNADAQQNVEDVPKTSKLQQDYILFTTKLHVQNVRNLSTF